MRVRPWRYSDQLRGCHKIKWSVPGSISSFVPHRRFFTIRVTRGPLFFYDFYSQRWKRFLKYTIVLRQTSMRIVKYLTKKHRICLPWGSIGRNNKESKIFVKAISITTSIYRKSIRKKNYSQIYAGNWRSKYSVTYCMKNISRTTYSFTF